MSSSKKPQTIGYWYRPLIHFGLWQGPIDALLEFRGGDRTAWRGRLEASDEFYVDALNLWGGESSEGGIAGYCDFMNGDADQQPNAYLAAKLGPMQPGYRGVSSIVFKGGRYGAMNPYPKPASFKGERALKGWDNDEPWYPEAAAIAVGKTRGFGYCFTCLATGNAGVLKRSSTGAVFGDLPDVDSGLGEDIKFLRAAGGRVYVVGDTNARVSADGGATWAAVEGLPDGLIPTDVAEANGVTIFIYTEHTNFYRATNGRQFSPVNVGVRGWFSIAGEGSEFIVASHSRVIAVSSNGGLAFVQEIVEPFGGSVDVSDIVRVPGGWLIAANWEQDFVLRTGTSTFSSVPHPSTSSSAGRVSFFWARRRLIAIETNLQCAYNDFDGSGWHQGASLPSVVYQVGNVAYNTQRGLVGLFTDALTTVNGTSWEPAGLPLGQYLVAALGRPGLEPGDIIGMNPAHIVYDSLTSVFMQGEPVETINEASFRAAADLFYNEGLGLCTEYSADQETVEEFRQRICNVVAARCSRSRVDGLWYLDPIRGDYDIDALPVLTDDDILEHEEQPSTLDDAVNQVTVQWFDTDLKESRTTAPMQALGAIMAAGAVNPELLQFPELAAESLANRVAARELHARATPLRRFKQVCNRTPYAWRIGTRFVIRAPRKGIEEMVCLVGDIDTGTLRSGAINLVAIQDAYGMPDATYLVAQPPQDTDNQTPQGSPQQRLVELPYVELVATLSRADMEALPPDVGYIGAIATAPRQGQSYSLYTHAAGEEFGEGSLGNWCPGAILNEAADYLTTDFTVAAQSSLALAEIGSRVLWELEECRLVAMDPEAGTISLARGCADTVPARHAAGTMLYFYDQWHAVDGREYADGETVSAKLLTRSGSQVQDPDEAPTLTHEILGRVHKPYPPAVFRINGEVAPAAASEAIELTWGHRDRVLQADQLVDNETAGLVAPEPGTTYTVRWFLDGVADGEQVGISGTTAIVEPSADGELRIEVWAVRDSLESYQAQVRELHYTLAPVELLETEASTLVETEAGDPISLE